MYYFVILIETFINSKSLLIFNMNELIKNEYERFRSSANWELNITLKALNKMPFLNTDEDNARIEAIKIIRKERRIK